MHKSSVNVRLGAEVVPRPPLQHVACSARLLSLACVAYYLLQPENGLFYRSGVRGK